MIPGDPASEASDSKPYNGNVVTPRIAQIMSDWIDGSGVPS